MEDKINRVMMASVAMFVINLMFSVGLVVKMKEMNEQKCDKTVCEQLVAEDCGLSPNSLE